MHLLIIHQVFMTEQDAGGTRHFEFARFLAEKGHRIIVITSDVEFFTGLKQDVKTSENLPSRIEIKRVKTYSKLHAGFFGRLLSFITFMINSFFTALRIKEIDAVFGTSPPIFQGVTAYLISKINRRPFVFEIRDVWPDFMVEIGAIKNPLLIYSARSLEKFLYKKAKLIIINSPGFKPLLLEKGVKDNKIRVVPNSADTSMFNPNSKGESIRERYNLVGKYVILYAGAIGKSNDIGTLIEAAAKLKDVDDMVFLLVGGGNELELIKKRVREDNLNNVILLPPIPKSYIPEVIAASDVCVAILKDVPMFKTTYPNKVFDYMAGGRPVLLAIDGVIRKVVEDANAGVFAQPGDAEDIAKGIMQLYKDRGRRIEMGINGRKYVEENFERKVQAEKLEKVLLDIIE